MTALRKHGEITVEVAPGRAALGEGKPSVSATYRNIASKDGIATTWDGATTLYDLWNQSVQKFGKHRCLGYRPVGADGKPGEYKFHTYSEVQALVDYAASALQQSGITAGGKVGILSANNEEWMVAAKAVDVVGACVVPIYDTLGESAVEYIINHSGLSLALVESSKLKAFIQVVDDVKEHVKTLVHIGAAPEDMVEKARDAGLKVYSFEDFIELGKAQAPVPSPPKPDDFICIMYTSGTTGAPKGVEITHRNLMTSIAGAHTILRQMGVTLGPGDFMLGYLPMAHIFDRLIEELLLSSGAAIGYWRGNVKLLLEDVKELRPTIFIAVPRILQRIADGVKHKVEAGSGLSKSLFNWAYSLKLWRLNRGAPAWWAGFGVDQLVFKKVRAAMGGRVRLIVSGGAPLAPHDEDFCKVALGPLLQGYGLTETCAASFIMLPNRPSMAYTVGPPLAATEFRFESVPELKYDAAAEPPKGEICIRGPAVFAGYYKDEEKTKEAFDEDGFFHTGDIGMLTPDGCLKIIDRKKNIFKMAQGEYIAVEHLESVFNRSDAVEQIWVYGNSFEQFLVAVVVPQERWLKERAGGEADLKAVASKPEVRKAMLDELSRVAKEGKLKGFENIKALYLETEAFSIENDLMTPSMKVKRPQLQKHYQKEIDAMYAALNKK
ncbi:hypothetical protein N2152v2_005436 [Parachlorella kessleri]